MTAKKTTKTAKTTSKTTTTHSTEDEGCVWQISNNCSGDLSKVEMFNHQIRIPICEKHLGEHKDIMLLHKNKYDVEEILNQTPEWRKQEVLTLKLSGLDEGEVEL